jgi:hypothetical protein
MAERGNERRKSMKKAIELVLSLSFPPSLSVLQMPREHVRWAGGDEHEENLGDGIVCGPMYDIRQTGIERMLRGEKFT